MMNELYSETMTVIRTGPLYYLRFPSFTRSGQVKHLFTTRRGGVSGGMLGPMNLSLRSGDRESNVLENYRRICFVGEMYPSDMVFLSPINGEKIITALPEDRGKGLMKPFGLEGIDGMVTNCKNVCLSVLYQDDIPMLLFDPVHHAIGLALLGWRNTAGGMAHKMIAAMEDRFGTKPKDLLVGLGPSLSAKYRYVNQDIAEIYQTVFPFYEDVLKRCEAAAGDEAGYLLNLTEVNRRMIFFSGVPSENISVSDLCTGEMEEYFHSGIRKSLAAPEVGYQGAFLSLI